MQTGGEAPDSRASVCLEQGRGSFPDPAVVAELSTCGRAALACGAGLLSPRAPGGRGQAGKQEDEDGPGRVRARVRAPASSNNRVHASAGPDLVFIDSKMPWPVVSLKRETPASYLYMMSLIKRCVLISETFRSEKQKTGHFYNPRISDLWEGLSVW